MTIQLQVSGAEIKADEEWPMYPCTFLGASSKIHFAVFMSLHYVLCKLYAFMCITDMFVLFAYHPQELTKELS